MADAPQTPQESRKLDGIAIGGKVVRKNSWPAKEGKSPSWSVELAYFGGKSNVSVSREQHDRSSVGSYQIFQVTQRAKDGAIYSTAIES